MAVTATSTEVDAAVTVAERVLGELDYLARRRVELDVATEIVTAKAAVVALVTKMGRPTTGNIYKA